jgi:hypothetical protein
MRWAFGLWIVVIMSAIITLLTDVPGLLKILVVALGLGYGGLLLRARAHR